MLPEISNIIAGVIGGIILALLGYGVTLIKQYKDRKKFPIKGEYITYFEDLKNDLTIMVTSLSEIKQKGMKLSGKTLADGRSWTLNGNIHGNGHITGMYSADAACDEGLGSFYLKIKGGDLEGMWTGYDHKNKITASGRYIFKNKASIKIREAVTEEIANILDLSLPLFGDGYVQDIPDFIRNKNGVALVAEEQGNIVGFVLGKLCVRDQALRIFRNTDEILPDIKHADKEGTLGILKTIGVSQSRQGHGIGELLFRKAELRLKNLGTKIIVVPAWKDRDTVTIDGLMNHFSYKKFFTDDEYWKKDCENKKFRCPSKQGNKCSCSVDFYKKAL